MRRHIKFSCTLAFAMICTVIGLPLAWGQAPVYQPGPLPTIGDLLHTTTKAIPTPQTRLNIGIYETVTVKVDKTTWNDTDYQVTGSGQVPVADTMGTVTWTPIGQGDCDPLTGETTTLIAAKKGGQVTVQASIKDSGTMGLDPVITKSVTFTVLEPGGITVLSAVDNAIVNTWTAGPPNNNMGMRSDFTIQITPTTVNFSNVPFQYTLPYLPGSQFTFPDNSTYPWPNTTGAFNVADAGAPAKNNIYVYDNAGLGLCVITKMANQNADFTVTATINFQFQGSDWSTFCNATSPRTFQGALNTLGKARVGLQASNLLYGNWMGPWQ